ncbi:MAG: YkgJ family cysteine cluster protein [Proteobacteria bacterium]|nr:YkgJ family cysteine cluster protein [Pseudomonadota bacterium]MBI3497897.1 YkgJ family cysteine cluster protein [Pseudomonadota bacterium]
MTLAPAAEDLEGFDCQTCGACCAYSSEWPRFTLEDDAALARIPPTLVDEGLGRMRCQGDRCAALIGEVGVSTSCSIYSVRPDVCRACQPGDEACLIARRRHGLEWSVPVPTGTAG